MLSSSEQAMPLSTLRLFTFGIVAVLSLPPGRYTAAVSATGDRQEVPASARLPAMRETMRGMYIIHADAKDSAYTAKDNSDREAIREWRPEVKEVFDAARARFWQRTRTGASH